MEHERPISRRCWIFLGIAVVGTLMPVTIVLPWLGEHGVNVSRLFEELFASRVSTLIAGDVASSTLAVVVAASRLSGITAVQRRTVGVDALLVGVSCRPTLLLFFWTRQDVTG